MTAINFPASPSNGDTHQGFVYNSTLGVWQSAGSQTAVTSFTGLSDTPSTLGTAGQIARINSGATALEFADQSGVTVYANADALPGSGNTGDLAFVTATNRLYIWNGSGWYNIALINTTPSISGVNSSYVLASDGTATVITITAVDAEGVPITYSIASDTSGNIATVTQGTGASSNVFTITPSTNDSNAGTFSLTFRASDGVNIASSIAAFTLEFKVVNSNYTTALITSVGANSAVNNTFVDSSSNSHTITTAGNVTQTTFSPYRHGGYSTYFDGSGDYLQPAGTTIFDISSSTASFTVEAWINPPALPSAGAYNYRFGGIISKGVVYVSFGFTNNGTLRFYTYSGVENYINSASGVIETGKWQHVALVSDAGSITLYKDGVSVATGTLVAPQAAGTGVAPKIATADTGQASDYINSYVSDLRVVDGTAVYTSAFTPPTERLTAITNTSLLTCHLPYIADGSTNGHAITVTGNTKTEAFAPYDYLKYDASINGGSMYFDGSGDKLTIPGTYANFGTNPFTVEAWVYPTTANGPIFNTHRAGTASGFYFSMSTTNNTILHGRYYGNNVETASPANTVKLNQWNHFAWCREGTGTNQTRMFANGKVVATYTDNQDYSSAPYGPFVGGYDPGGAQYDADGNIADLRVVSGTALYTAEFTPPTAPLTAVTNTALLINGTNAGIIDKSQSVQTLTLNGNVSSSTTQSKYLTSSMYFDGAGDYITMTPSDLFAFGTGDFTIEGWAYITATGDRGLFQQGTSNFPVTNSNSVALQITNASPADSEWAIYAANGYHESTVNYSLNQWYHFAVVRASAVTKLYIDGTEALSVSDSVNYTGTYFGVGSIYGAANAQCFTGYMSDFRITKGLARYTANFTPPTAELKG